MERSTAPVPEVPVRLRVNDRPVVTWTASPDALEALGVGRLMAMGYVRGPADVVEIRATGPDGHGIHGIDARVPAERVEAAEEERRHRREHGCGLRFLLDCRPELLPRRGAEGAPEPSAPGGPPPLSAFPDLFRDLFDRSPSRRTTGGHHTAGLCDGAGLLYLHEEVGRHNAADKAIGAALLSGRDLDDLGLVTTARISGEMVEKAVRAGLAWVASRSVPTTLAVEIAGAAGVALVARAPGKEARVFHGPGDDAGSG